MHTHADSAARQPRRLQARVDHPVVGERRGDEAAELQLPVEPSGISVSGTERESAPSRDVADLRIEPFGGIQDALENPAALEVYQDPLEAALLRRREVQCLLFALTLQRLGARRRVLSVDLGNSDQYGCRDQQRRAPVPHAAAGSASAVNRRFSRARLAASASHTRTIARFTSAKPRTDMASH